MRSTRAIGAVERLKRRSGNNGYAMILKSDGTFCLMLTADGAAPVQQGEPLPMEEFIKFVEAFGPQIPRRATKSDLAFEAQLVKKKS